MTRLSAATMFSALLAWPLAATAQGTDLAGWNATRAGLFSDVCMASAPSFAAFEVNAKAAGFTAGQDDLVFPPEVTVTLLSDIGLCRCLMVMGAPDPIALSDEIFETLLADFPGAWGQLKGETGIGSRAFLLDGVPVYYGTSITSLETQPGIVASVQIKGDCAA